MCSFHLMVKIVYCCCVRGRQLFSNPVTYVTGFGKTWLVHTSNFSTLVTHKISYEWQINIKLSGIVELLFPYHSWKYQICMPFSVVVMDIRMWKIRCVTINYARFPKSGHIYRLSQYGSDGRYWKFKSETILIQYLRIWPIFDIFDTTPHSCLIYVNYFKNTNMFTCFDFNTCPAFLKLCSDGKDGP